MTPIVTPAAPVMWSRCTSLWHAADCRSPAFCALYEHTQCLYSFLGDGCLDGFLLAAIVDSGSTHLPDREIRSHRSRESEAQGGKDSQKRGSQA